MSGWTLGEIARAVAGELRDAEPSTTVTGRTLTDSRAAGPGDLFIALPGERVDGHDFAAAAVAVGAVAALVVSGRDYPTPLPRIEVADTERALGEFAAAHRARLSGATVIGVTGSAGKTTTKDLIADLLPLVGPTVAAPGSFNNDVGMPLTILSAGPETSALVLEMGARGLGHIARLCRIASPDIGVVLMVGAAHVGEFGGLERTAMAKGELVEALPASGVAVLNRDDPRVAAMAERTAADVCWFGRSFDADVRAEEVELVDGRAAFRLVTPKGAARVRLQLLGEHAVGNALAAAAVGHAMGLPPDAMAAALSAAEPRSRWRMEVTDAPGGITVINDAYNANPESMAAALRTLSAVAAGRRSWAVLGAMRELGDDAAAEHAALGRLAGELGVDRLVAVGPDAADLLAADLAGTEGIAVGDVDEALLLLREQATSGDVILVKASRSEGLERVADGLLGSPE